YTAFEIMNILLGSGNDTFTVTSSPSSTFTSILSGPGNDRLILADAQFIKGRFDGQAGIDTIDYSGWTTGISVDLVTGRGTGIFDNADDGIRRVENATGGAGNDFLIGDSGDNVLIGNNGNDFLQGTAGNDTLSGGAGDNKYLGDAGNDVYLLLDGGNN